ncbi:hypothetical protein VTO73DRAFT_12709 [Trametes versicolor]
MSGAYDERLLASAPAATRAEKQEGYNIDLLDDRHAAPTSHTPPPVPVLSANHTKAEAGGYAYPPPARLPWYKTRKWIFIMALGTVVVLAAVIGGAVGGTYRGRGCGRSGCDGGRGRGHRSDNDERRESSECGVRGSERKPSAIGCFSGDHLRSGRVIWIVHLSSAALLDFGRVNLNCMLFQTRACTTTISRYLPIELYARQECERGKWGKGEGYLPYVVGADMFAGTSVQPLVLVAVVIARRTVSGQV